MKLNKEQYIAAHHTNGPMLVLAGPGSGKTHLLVERIRIMTKEKGIDPSSILVITFSKKAACEMEARFKRRTEDEVLPVTFGTFHAVFYHILRTYEPDIKRLITEEEQKEFLSRVMREENIGSELFSNEDNTEEILGIISAYKNFGEDFYEKSEAGRGMDECERNDLCTVNAAYRRLVERSGLIDFDDMITRCRDILYNHESVLRMWQKRYRYFLVDEFQDINGAQYDVLRLLAGDERNVFAVGDDDQSIYAFRGARPELMKKFIRQYPGCRRVTLTMNYRCCENVIGAADSLIRHNFDRLDRPMQRHLPSMSGGEVYIVNSESSDVQAAYVCDTIEKFVGDGVCTMKEIAVLYRSEHCARLLRRVAKKRGVTPKMMSAHASKGLEFKCVFVIGLQEGLFPHHRNMWGNAEEERRLMYVAMTRAKEKLYMCTISTEHGKRPSRFAAESASKKRYITDSYRLIRLS